MASQHPVRPLGSGSDWDPISEETVKNPRRVYADLRNRCPVAHSERWGGFYTLTRHADVVAASRDPETFTATKQTVIPTSPRKGLARLPLQVDPPEHTIYRRALNPFFKEDKMRALEPEIAALAERLYDDLLTGETIDFANDFAAPFTQGTLCILVGLDLAEAGRLGHLSHEYVKAIQAESLSMAGGFSREIDQFAIDLVADRKKHPRNPETDMATGLLADKSGTKPFTDDEVAGMIRLLLIGGHVVPKNFLGSAAYHLAMHADLQEGLRQGRIALRPAIEELLRFYAPNQALVRVTTKDTEIGGRKIPAGCPVALHFLSANQDEDVFENASQFDPERKPNRHIAFGTGPHVCIGQSLARMQARLMVEGLLNRTRHFAISGKPQWARWTEFGIAELSLKVGPI